MFEFLKRIFKGKRLDSTPAAQPDPVAIYAITSDTGGNNAGKSEKNIAGVSTEGPANNIADAGVSDDSFDGDADSIEDGDFDF